MAAVTSLERAMDECSLRDASNWCYGKIGRIEYRINLNNYLGV